MSSLLKLRRGSTVAHETFTGADGEVTFNTDTNALVTHDGATAGGFEHTTAAALAASTGSSLIGYLPAGAGAVARNVESKLREIVSPEDSDAVGDGLTDSSLEFQSAITDIPTDGVLVLGAGKTYIANSLKISKSICIDLNGATIKSTAYASGMSKKIFYAEAADNVPWITIKNGKLNGVGTSRGATATEMESLIDFDTVKSVNLLSVDIAEHASGVLSVPAAIKERKTGCVRIRNATRVNIDNVVLHDNWNEQIDVYSDYGHECYTEINGVKSYRGTINPANTPIEVTGGRVKVSGCHLLDTNASAMNFQATVSAVITGNTIVNNSGDGYGINFGQDGLAGYTDNILIQGNYIEGTLKGAISIMGSNIKVLDNILVRPGGFGIKARAVYNAAAVAALLPGYPAMSHKHLSDLQICDNTILDTAYGSSIEGAAIHISMTDSGYAWKNPKVNNNYIDQPGLNATRVLRYGVVLSEVIDAEVIANTIKEATLSPIYVSGQVETLRIKHNKFRSSSWNTQTDTTLEFYAPGRAFSAVTIEENEFNTRPLPNRYDIFMEGGVPTNWKIINNKGILQGYAGLTGVVEYVKDDYPQQTSIPTGGTFNLYDAVHSIPAASGVEGWVNVDRRGTFGTLNAGATTGTMTAGASTVVVNSVTGLAVGQVISVFGAISTGVGAVVLDITGLTVTLSSNAGASVTGALVDYVNPVFKTVGAIGA